MVEEDTFDDLVEGVSSNEEIKKEIEESSFGSMDIQDFTVFNQIDEESVSGEYSFYIEHHELEDAIGTTSQTVSCSNTRKGYVKLMVFQNRIKFSTFDQSTFSEIVIPLVGECSAIKDPKGSVSFVLDHLVLSNAISNCDEPIMNFTYTPEKSSLFVRKDQGSEGLTWTTYPLSEFTNYHAKIGTSFGDKLKINPKVLQDGLRYADLFIKKDNAQTALSLIEVRDSAVHSGDQNAIGVYKSVGLAGLSMRIKYEIKDIVESMLGRFKQDNSYLFVTENHYIVRDENRFFGFEKCHETFPLVDNVFNKRSDTSVFIPRGPLLKTLNWISQPMDRDLRVEVRVTGAGADTMIFLKTKDPSGKPSNGKLKAERKSNREDVSLPYEDWGMEVSFKSLKDLVDHFQTSKTANVHWEILGGKVLLVRESDPDYDAKSLLSFVTFAAEKINQDG